MPTCINCDEEFVAKRKDASLCSPKCRMAWSRKKAVEEGEVSEEESAKPVKSKSHVLLLKEKVKERILAKSGNPEGSSSTSGSEIPPVPAALCAGVERLRGHAQDLVYEGIVSQKTADSAIKMVLGSFTPHPIENHGTTNDLARQTILNRVKRPEATDLSKPQFNKKKGE